MERYELYERFRALHVRKQGFVMPNAWDGVSALLIKKTGFQAMETSAAAFSFSLGVPDGVGAVSRSEEIDNAVTIGTLTGLPVNGDFENGFGPSPEDCVATVEAAIEAGVAGLSIDDTTNDPLHPVHDFDAAVARIAAAATVAKGRILLTGKTAISCTATKTRTRRSGGSSRSPRSAPTCSSRRSRPTLPRSRRS